MHPKVAHQPNTQAEEVKMWPSLAQRSPDRLLARQLRPHRVLPNGDVTCRHLLRCIAIKAMMHNRRKIYSSSRHSPACVSFHGFAAHTASTGVS